MILSTRYAGRIAIIDLHGRMTLSPAVNRIQRRIESLLLVKPASALVLNLSAVSAMDSSGLGELVKIQTYAKQRGMRIALTGVEPRIREMLKITRLDALLPICADEVLALKQVSQPEIADQA